MSDGEESVVIQAPERTEPAMVLNEREMLDGWLDYHRATLLRKCADLTDDQLCEASCPPSNLTLLGLVRHLTDVERGWFLRGVAGRPRDQVKPLYYSDADPEGDVESLGSAPVEDVFETYRATLSEIRAAVRDVDLDHTFANGAQQCSTRWVYLHMIEEYARHNGHADLIRERVDGAVGD
jgi:hypothetical protein